MPEIVLHPVAAPNFHAVNNLMAQAAQNYQNAFQGLQGTVKNAQTAIRDQNTERLMGYLNGAQSAAQLNDPNFQQGLNALRESLGGEYHTDQFQKRMQTLPDQLNQRELAGLQLQQTRDQMGDAQLGNQIAQLMQAGKFNEAGALMGQAKTDMSRFVTMADSLQNSAMSRQNMQHSMGLQDKEWNMKVQQYNDQKKMQQLALQQLQGMGILPEGVAPNAAGGGGAPSGAPANIQQIISKVSKEQGVPENILYAVMRQESSYNPRAVSPVGAQGLMQLMPATAAELGLKGEDVWDPYKNVTAGAKYLKQMYTKFGSLAKGLAAYNAGPGRLQKALEKGGDNWSIHLPKETRDYVASIGKKMGYKPTDAELKAATKKLQQAKVPFANQPFVPLADGNSSRPGAQADILSMAKQVLGGSGEVDNPFMDMASRAGGDPKIFKAMADLNQKTSKIASDSEKELLNKSLSTHPIMQNMGKFPGTMKDWEDKKVGWIFPGDAGKVMKAIEKNPDYQKLDEPYRVAAAQALLEQAKDYGLSAGEVNARAAELLKTFNNLRASRDQADADLANSQYQQAIFEQQLSQQAATRKEQLAMLRKLTGL
ncbi:TPA: lytic transglycosylase domain-containing protein [Acinetobacter baumannii]